METAVSLFDRMERIISGQLTTSDIRKKGEYAMIPMRHDIVERQLEFVHELLGGYNRNGREKFIDAGCGAGFRVLQATNYFDSYGVDLDPKYVAFGKKYLKLNLELKNIFDVDYSKYDIVYFYCPIQETKLEIKFERYLYDNVKPGTYIIANGAYYIGRGQIFNVQTQSYHENDMNLQEISYKYHIYRK